MINTDPIRHLNANVLMGGLAAQQSGQPGAANAAAGATGAGPAGHAKAKPAATGASRSENVDGGRAEGTGATDKTDVEKVEAEREMKALEKVAAERTEAEAEKIKAGAEAADSNEKFVERLASNLDAFLSRINTDLKLVVDRDTGKVVVRVVDPETKEVIREIPPEEMLEISKRIDEILEDYASRGRKDISFIKNSA